ncbi:hypothetical protein LINPERHAP2_LOCUS39004, partial [Linum perenne]
MQRKISVREGGGGEGRLGEDKHDGAAAAVRRRGGDAVSPFSFLFRYQSEKEAAVRGGSAKT